MTTFNVGDMVEIDPDKVMPWQPKGKFKVTRVKNVPVEDIPYNPETHEGGVAHHQWLWIDYEKTPGPYSGWFFEPWENDQ